MRFTVAIFNTGAGFEGILDCLKLRLKSQSGAAVFRGSVEAFVLFLAAVNGASPVDAPGSGVAKGLLHSFDMGRQLLELSWLPGEVLLESAKPDGYQRFVAIADASDLGA